MSSPIHKGDNTEEVIRAHEDVQRVGLQFFYTPTIVINTAMKPQLYFKNTDVMIRQKLLSERPLDLIRSRVSKSSRAPQLNAEGFRRIPNPLNWKIVPKTEVEPQSKPDFTPVYLEIQDELHSVQTLQFLGFQLANAQKKFAISLHTSTGTPITASDLRSLRKVIQKLQSVWPTLLR